MSISHGDYFRSVRSFLEQNRLETLTSAIAHHFNREIRPKEIEEIRIVLEKHGEFYHPARIEVIACEKAVSLVVNVAVSQVGNKYILNEFNISGFMRIG